MAVGGARAGVWPRRGKEAAEREEKKIGKRIGSRELEAPHSRMIESGGPDLPPPLLSPMPHGFPPPLSSQALQELVRLVAEHSLIDSPTLSASFLRANISRSGKLSPGELGELVAAHGVSALSQGDLLALREALDADGDGLSFASWARGVERAHDEDCHMRSSARAAAEQTLALSAREGGVDHRYHRRRSSSA